MSRSPLSPTALLSSYSDRSGRGLCTNCVEPLDGATGLAFFCNECIQGEAAKIWEERQTQHNASWPPVDQMSSEQYDQWYAEHRQLEDEYARDRKLYELDLQTKLRPSNICSAIEASKEEMDFAKELDSLSLSLMASNEDPGIQNSIHSHTRTRVSIPSDASEQLHWSLNTLALDRGSCGVEYTSSPSGDPMSALRHMDDDALWRKARDRE